MLAIDAFIPYLKWIETQRERMTSLVEQWANINSGSDNLQGLATMLAEARQAYAPLGDLTQDIRLPNRLTITEKGVVESKPSANGLSIIKRASAPLQVFLNGHIDTVYSSHDTFQKCHRDSPDLMIGPGVTDMKGGLVILLLALEALERSPFRSGLGWEVFLCPDEEIGSPSSCYYLQRRAPYFDFGMIVEPQFPDGAFVSARKGSCTFALVAHGKSAHDGRNFHEGINAIAALLRPLQKIQELNRPRSATTINIGTIRGGTATNQVPDVAMARICLRAATQTDLRHYQALLYDIVEEENTAGARLELHQFTMRRPKSFDSDTQALFNTAKRCAEHLGLPMTWRESGGVSDGNTLEALGLPVIDTMGAAGGGIHTHNEYIDLDKLVPRAQHLALMLMHYGSLVKETT